MSSLMRNAALAVARNTRSSAAQVTAVSASPALLSAVCTNPSLDSSAVDLLLTMKLPAVLAVPAVARKLTDAQVVKVARTETRTTVLAELVARNTVPSVLVDRVLVQPKLRTESLMTELRIAIVHGRMSIEDSDRLAFAGDHELMLSAVSRPGSALTDEQVSELLTTLGWADSQVLNTVRALLVSRPGLFDAAVAHRPLHAAAATSSHLYGRLDAQHRMASAACDTEGAYPWERRGVAAALAANPCTDPSTVWMLEQHYSPGSADWYSCNEAVTAVQHRMGFPDWESLTWDPSVPPSCDAQYALVRDWALPAASGVTGDVALLDMALRFEGLTAEGARLVCDDLHYAHDPRGVQCQLRPPSDAERGLMVAAVGKLVDRFGLTVDCHVCNPGHGRPAPTATRVPFTPSGGLERPVRVAGHMRDEATGEDVVVRVLDSRFGDDVQAWALAWAMLPTAPESVTVADFVDMVCDCVG